MKRTVSAILTVCFTVSVLGNSFAFALSREEVRSKNVQACVDQFIQEAPMDFKMKNIALSFNETQKEAGWLQDGVLTALLNKSISIVEQNKASQEGLSAEYVLNCTLIEDKKDSVKIGFKLIDARTNRLVKYYAAKASETPEKFDYERRAPQPAYVKPQGRPWGLYVLVGTLLVGYILIPKL